MSGETEYVLLPRDCTMEMIRAGEDEYASPSPVYDEDGDEGDWLSPIQAVWYAMMAAAPSPPKPEAPSREKVIEALREKTSTDPNDEEEMADFIITLFKETTNDSL